MLIGDLVAGEPPGEHIAAKDQHHQQHEDSSADEIGRGILFQPCGELTRAPGLPGISPELPVVAEDDRRDADDGQPAAHKRAQRMDLGPRLIEPFLRGRLYRFCWLGRRGSLCGGLLPRLGGWVLNVGVVVGFPHQSPANRA